MTTLNIDPPDDELEELRTMLEEAEHQTDHPKEKAIIATLAILIREHQALAKRVSAIQEHLQPF